MKNEHTNNQYVEFEGVSKLVLDENERIVLNLDNWNEVPPGYAASLRSGDKGGVQLKYRAEARVRIKCQATSLRLQSILPSRSRSLAHACRAYRVRRGYSRSVRGASAQTRIRVHLMLR